MTPRRLSAGESCRSSLRSEVVADAEQFIAVRTREEDRLLEEAFVRSIDSFERL